MTRSSENVHLNSFKKRKDVILLKKEENKKKVVVLVVVVVHFRPFPPSFCKIRVSVGELFQTQIHLFSNADVYNEVFTIPVIWQDANHLSWQQAINVGRCSIHEFLTDL